MPKQESIRLLVTSIQQQMVIILLIDYTTAGHRLFGTAPISWSAWLIVLPFAIAMLTLEEARKAFMRSGDERRHPSR